MAESTMTSVTADWLASVAWFSERQPFGLVSGQNLSCGPSCRPAFTSPSGRHVEVVPVVVEDEVVLVACGNCWSSTPTPARDSVLSVKTLPKYLFCTSLTYQAVPLESVMRVLSWGIRSSGTVVL